MRPTEDDPIRGLVDQRRGRYWCMFLDRDGVLNRRIVGDYVRSWRDFEWSPGAFEALRILRAWAPNLVVVTNQQGIGKGLMTSKEVVEIHGRIRGELAAIDVVIDEFRVCPHLVSDQCGCRKPKPGLIREWLQARPDIEPSLSIMVGDSQSDLELAQNVKADFGGCAYIQIGRLTTEGAFRETATFETLWDFAAAVESVRSGRTYP